MEQFYAYMDRMKFIKRWQLMRSVREENIMEHSQSVAMLTHALVVIENDVFGGMEKIANTLPAEMRGGIEPYLQADKESEEYAFVKAADKLSAYIKCLEELRSGNKEFSQAEKTIGAALKEKKMRALDYFFEHFIPAFSLTLDELEGL